ncbi:MAG: hypothetical protein LBC67_06160 [Spirochaetales bacterium]|jgi:hypothetical protein|nr:hypothetical protein [Spirochaetales bacterium]
MMKNLEQPAAENFRALFAGMDRELLADVLSLLLAERSEAPVSLPEEDVPVFQNFAGAVLFLKAKYDFEELELFTAEAGFVYVNLGERRVLLTGRPAGGKFGLGEGVRGASREAPQGNTESPAGGRFSHLEMGEE